jgi:hypothetical protein
MHEGVGEQSDGSVMFSLKELRELETERIVSEAAAERQRELALELAHEEASARAALMAESHHRALIDAQREAEAARARVERENELRLIAMEARLHQEAELQLAQARREAQARAQAALRKASPLRRIAPVLAVVLLAATATVGWIMHSGEQQLERDRQAALARAQRTEQELAAQRAAAEQRLHARLGTLRQQLEVKEQETAKITANLPRERQPQASRSLKKAAASRHRTPAKSVLEAADPHGLGLLDNL